MRRILFIAFLLCTFHSIGQYYDHSYNSTGFGDLKPTLFEQTNDRGYICIGDSLLMKIDSLGDVVWAKTISVQDPVALELDSDQNIYFLDHLLDSSGHTFSRLVKTNPEGLFMWEKDFGNGYDEVVYRDIYVDNVNYFYMVGEMKTDSVWHNLFSKFQFTGAEEWSRRIWHWEGQLESPIPNYTSLIKLDRVNGGRFYALGQIDSMTLVVEFNENSGFHQFEKYAFADSLLPVDIVANGIDDIQVLMNAYEFKDHNHTYSAVKMQLDHDLEVLHAYEYWKPLAHLKAVDLEVKEYTCYIMTNTLSGYQRSFLERTYLSGAHDLSREILDQDTTQYCFDIELEANLDLTSIYQFGSDSTHVINKINAGFQNNCSYQFGTLLNNQEIDINKYMATPITMTAAYPQISEGYYSYTDIMPVHTTQECDGTIGTEKDEISVLVYPNPCKTHFSVKSNSPINSIRLFDQAGRLILETDASIVNVSELTAGIYTVLVLTEAGNFSEKLIIR